MPEGKPSAPPSAATVSAAEKPEVVAAKAAAEAERQPEIEIEINPLRAICNLPSGEEDAQEDEGGHVAGKEKSKL